MTGPPRRPLSGNLYGSVGTTRVVFDPPQRLRLPCFHAGCNRHVKTYMPKQSIAVKVLRSCGGGRWPLIITKPVFRQTKSTNPWLLVAIQHPESLGLSRGKLKVGQSDYPEGSIGIHNQAEQPCYKVFFIFLAKITCRRNAIHSRFRPISARLLVHRQNPITRPLHYLQTRHAPISDYPPRPC